MGTRVLLSNSTVLYYSMIKVMSVASGDISQKLHKGELCTLPTEECGECGFDLRAISGSDSSAGVWTSSDDTTPTLPIIYLLPLQTLSHSVTVLRRHSFKAQDGHFRKSLLSLTQADGSSYHLHVLTLRI